MSCPSTPTAADPANPEPAEARPESCTGCDGTREPDPTDFFIGMMKEVARHSVELSSLVVVEARNAVVEAESVASAEAAPKPAVPRNPWYSAAALAHARLARSLRLSMALAIKAHEDRLTRETRIADALAAKTRERKQRLKKQVEKTVEQAIERHVERERERLIESEDEIYDEQAGIDLELDLKEALTERLEDEDIERDIEATSRDAMAARICGDLNIEPAQDRWGGSQRAQEEAGQTVPGSSFVEPSPPDPGEPEAALVPEAEPDAAKPPEPVAEPEAPAMPVWGTKEWFQSAEHKRECEEYQERVRRRLFGPP